MSAIEIVDERDEFRLVRNGERFSVLECRGDKVLSCHCGHQRREAYDNEAGMEIVVGRDGWMSEDQARQGFLAMVEDEVHWAEVIW